MPGLYTNGVSVVGPALTAYRQMTGYETLPADTHTLTQTSVTAGVAPESVATTAFHIAALATAIQLNTQTSTANAATSNTFAGRIVTEAVTTAANATYTMTLTNSLVTATSTVLASVQSGTSTAGRPVVDSITPAAGSVVIIIRNIGTVALNGTLLISWMAAVD